MILISTYQRAMPDLKDLKAHKAQMAHKVTEGLKAMTAIVAHKATSATVAHKATLAIVAHMVIQAQAA